MILDLNEPLSCPFNSAGAQIVSPNCGRAVENLCFDGRRWSRDGKLVNVDEAKLAAAAAGLAPPSGVTPRSRGPQRRPHDAAARRQSRAWKVRSIRTLHRPKET